MSLPPVFPASFYKLLAEGARRWGISRSKLAIDALRLYLNSLETKNAPSTKALGSEDLALQFAKAQSKISKQWWANLTPEERAARAKKANEARWPKQKS